MASKKRKCRCQPKPKTQPGEHQCPKAQELAAKAASVKDIREALAPLQMTEEQKAAARKAHAEEKADGKLPPFPPELEKILATPTKPQTWAKPEQVEARAQSIPHHPRLAAFWRELTAPLAPLERFILVRIGYAVTAIAFAAVIPWAWWTARVVWPIARAWAKQHGA